MKILKRNQIIISVLALMLITVGYMSYTSAMKNSVETGALMDAETMAGLGDAKLVNSNNAINDESNESGEKNDETTVETAESAINDTSEDLSNGTSASSTSTINEMEKNDKNNKSQETSATNYEADYFVASKLERDKMYSQMLETYQSLAENGNVSPEQKNTSTQEITNINNKKNSIMIAENLIKNLGFDDVVIFVNDSSTSVIIKAEKLSEADIAQIQNIVCREIGVEAETIHISVK